MKLTKTQLDALTCPPGKKDVLFFADHPKGFAVRVTAGGAKVFLFQYRAGGKVRRIVIGEYGTFTLEGARRQAEQLRGQVRGGGDPAEERASARRQAEEKARLEGLTLGLLVADWQAAKATQRRERPLKAAERIMRHHFGAWWDKPAVSLTPEDVAAVQEAALRRGAPGAALDAYRIGRTIFNWAVGARKVATSPFREVARPAHDSRRDRVMSDAELGEYWRAAGGLPYPWGPWARMLALTLQRRDQVAGMRWSELEAEGMEWHIPAERAKNKRPHVVHLTPAARAILADVPRQAGRDLVFTTNGETKISAFSKLILRLKTDIGVERQEGARESGGGIGRVPDWTFHDLRRTGVTAMARMGIAPQVADKILHHEGGTISGVAAIYQRFQWMEERRAAMETWEAYILAVAEGRDPKKPVAPPDPKGKVVELAAAKRRRQPIS